MSAAATREARTTRSTLPEVLRAGAERDPARVVLELGRQRVTYAALWEGAVAAAAQLARIGVGRGDVVATLTENCLEQAHLQFGAGLLGAVDVMVNTAYSGDLLAQQLRRCRAKVILVDDHLLPHVLAVRERLPDMAHVIVRGNGELPAGADSLGAELRADPHGFQPVSGVDWSDPCAIVFTSGTTGASKGVMINHQYLLQFAETLSSFWHRGDPEAAFYCTTPMYHCAANGIGVVGAVVQGGRCVLDEHFSASRFWDRLERARCTSTMLLGTMPMMLWNQPLRANESVRDVIALPIPVDLMKPMEERWGCEFHTMYGLSEASPLTMSTPGVSFPAGSAGTINDAVYEVRIVDEHDLEVPPGVQGEIVARPRLPQVMFSGYVGDPEATVRQWRNLWFHTGDLGRVDQDGNLWFLDRQKDYMRRRGENISSYEVERAVDRHPSVAEVAAVGVPDDLGEDEVLVEVVPAAGAAIDPVELFHHCRQHLPHFAVPRYVRVVERLPKNAIGKVEKQRIRSRGVTPQTWDREAAGLVAGRVRRPGKETA